jgi:hypothetical protein
VDNFPPSPAQALSNAPSISSTSYGIYRLFPLAKQAALATIEASQPNPDFGGNRLGYADLFDLVS